jgi:DNA topoisomerase IA
MSDAEILRTKVIANTEKKDIPDFHANGSRTIFPGWLLADEEGKGDDIELPKFKNNDSLDLIDIKSEEKKTEPPPTWENSTRNICMKIWYIFLFCICNYFCS